MDELREAAERLRKLAAGASDNWTVDVAGPLGPKVVLAQRVAVTNLWPDAAYIDLMKPTVALALADLLDMTAQTIWTQRESLALARAILSDQS